MNRYIAIAAMYGIAFGAITYRAGWLPFGWSSPWQFVLIGGAIGLAVSATQILRNPPVDREIKRPAAPLLVGFGAVGALLGFGAGWLAFPTLERARLETRRFPGFTLAMPSGSVAEDVRDYAAGKLTLKHVANSGTVLAVEWSAGTAMTDEEVGMVAHAMSGVLQSAKGVESSPSITTLRGPNGEAVKTAIVDAGNRGKLTMSSLSCGTRNIMVATMGHHDEVATLHQRVVASFTCKPDPAQEPAATLHFPLVLDLPGWYAEYHEADQIGITDGENGHLTLRTMPRTLNVDLAQVVKPMFEAAGAQNVEVGVMRDGRIPIKVAVDGETALGWVKHVKCPTTDAFVIAIASDDATADLLHQRVSEARCIAKGEPPQQWPPAPPAAPDEPAEAPAPGQAAP